MCRWLAYSGSPLLLEELLLKPTHSLIDQSLHSELGATTTNGDGFGLGWYGAEETPGIFHSTDPAWTPLFVPAAGVVVNVGAQFSHAIIVSRELGIPCVVSVTGATDSIPDGATITVDGGSGTVTVH